MTTNIVVPSLGESVTEATVSKWYKKVGEQISIDELLIELETDKVTLEVTATITGTIKEIKFNEGDVVNVGGILGIIEEGAINSSLTDKNKQTAEQTALPKQEQASSGGQTFSPAAGKIAAENNIEYVAEATGKDGRVTKHDVLSAIRSPQQYRSQSQLEERVKMTRLRKTIAKRLKDSQNTAAILSTFNEIDMSAAINYRKNYQDDFKEKHGVKLGFMSFFVKATVTALKEMPSLNAEIDGDYLVYKNYYNVGVAVGTEQGLVVPIVKNADQMIHAEIEKEIASLGKKAREGKLSINDMQGGTFSITNGGIYGSLFSTPIINPPQSAILGMHNIVPRPIAVNGEVVVLPMMYVALSYDHRIIDGSEAVRFLSRIKELVETPEKILLSL